MKRRLTILSILFFSFALFGCQTTATTTYYLGAKADAKEVINLSAEQTQQRWQDVYVAIDYSYTRQGNQFDLDGLFSFSESAKINYQAVNRFKLYLYLLDKNMRVVEYREILRVLGYNIEDQDKFNAHFTLDEKVVAFTFGYDGMLREDEGLSHPIWKLPKRGK